VGDVILRRGEVQEKKGAASRNYLNRFLDCARNDICRIGSEPRLGRPQGNAEYLFERAVFHRVCSVPVCYEGGDIVVAAGFVGGGDKFVTCGVGICFGFQYGGDFFAAYHVRQAVGAEQDAVVLAKLEGRNERPGLFLHADVMRQLAAGGVVGRFFRFDVTILYQFRNHRMVARQLAEAPRPQAICPAVAHVGDEAAVFPEQRDYGSSAHVLVARLAVSFEVQLPALLGDGFAQQSLYGSRRADLELVERVFDHYRQVVGDDAGGKRAAPVASHAVGYDKESHVRIGEERILILLADFADVSPGAPAERAIDAGRLLHSCGNYRVTLLIFRQGSVHTRDNNSRRPNPRTSRNGRTFRGMAGHARACLPFDDTTGNSA